MVKDRLKRAGRKERAKENRSVIYRVFGRWVGLMTAVLFSAWAGMSQATDDSDAGDLYADSLHLLPQSGQVAGVIDGRTVRLTDGREIRLIGLDVPQPPLGSIPQQSVAMDDVGVRQDPQQADDNFLAHAARSALETMLLGKTVTLRFSQQPMDRYGRWLAHVIRDDGLWIQGALLSDGWGWVHSFRDNRARIGEMLALEAVARRNKSGIWADPAYRVLTATTAREAMGRFALIEGRVHQVAVVRGTTFLNFGHNWREDFTIRITNRDRRRFEAAGYSMSDYQGRRVRVRGMVESWNGPMIRIDHPERIEILDETGFSGGQSVTP